MVTRFVIVVASVVFGLAACSSCQPTPQPAPPAPPDPRAVTIYNELVEAGCLAPDDGGAATVAAEHALGDAQESWLVCLYNGGTIQGCKVPCQ